VQKYEEFCESMNMRYWIGMDNMTLDIGGDERHYILAQDKRRTIVGEIDLGLIAIDECFFGP
jgi:hypothetical protein